MNTFTSNSEFRVIACYKCHVQFGMSSEMYRRRLDDHQSFWCTAGHEQHFTGPTEAQRLEREVERQRQMREAAEARERAANEHRRQIDKAHKRMRVRIANGVCPCCNRTFQNLMSHMRTEHPDFAQNQTLRAVRTAFGMTQAQVAEEARVHNCQVSNFERGRSVPKVAAQRLQWWLEEHAGKVLADQSSPGG